MSSVHVSESELTVDIEASSAGHDACIILCWHSVPTSVLFQGRLDDHTQVATVVLVHAGEKKVTYKDYLNIPTSCNVVQMQAKESTNKG